MNPLLRFVKLVSKRARHRRGEIFRRSFPLSADTRILDLGSGNGVHIASVLRGTDVVPENVVMADIDERRLVESHRRYGFSWVVVPETGRCPFPDKFFDIVFCSSVIAPLYTSRGSSPRDQEMVVHVREL